MKQLKKLMAVMILLALALSTPVSSFGAIGQLPVSLSVNGKLVVSDLEPLKLDNRTYLPLRAVAKALGAKVSWDTQSRKCVITRNQTTLEFYLGRSYYLKNGKKFALDAPVELYNDRVILPVRVISEALGEKVYWNEDLQEVSIGKDNSIASKYYFDFKQKVGWKYSSNVVQTSIVGDWRQKVSYMDADTETILYIHNLAGNNFKVYRLREYGNIPAVELRIGTGTFVGDRFHMIFADDAPYVTSPEPLSNVEFFEEEYELEGDHLNLVSRKVIGKNSYAVDFNNPLYYMPYESIKG